MRNLEKMNNVVLKGDMEEASYKTQMLTEYAHNPFSKLTAIFTILILFNYFIPALIVVYR